MIEPGDIEKGVLMNTAEVITDNFMRDLEEGKLKRDHQTNNGADLHESYIRDKIKTFDKLLDSDLAEALF